MLKGNLDELKEDLSKSNYVSTITNYNVAIIPYPPSEEIDIRRKIKEFEKEKFSKKGPQKIISINITDSFFSYLNSSKELIDTAEIIEIEKTLFQQSDSLEPLTNFLLKDVFEDLLYDKSKFPTYLTERIKEQLKSSLRKIKSAEKDATKKPEKCSIILYGIGGLYPSIRPSSLLRYLHSILQWEFKSHLSIILFYPGKTEDNFGLKFMNKGLPDHDYRPKIYRSFERKSK